MNYSDFRTGLTFGAVFQELKVEQMGAFEREGRRMFITRHTVLGRWHQHKLTGWAIYQREKPSRMTIICANSHEVDTGIPCGEVRYWGTCGCTTVTVHYSGLHSWCNGCGANVSRRRVEKCGHVPAGSGERLYCVKCGEQVDDL